MTPFTVRCVLAAILLFILVGPAGTDPLSGDIRFDHLGIPDGLSSSSVSSIVQDNEGFIWFGTQSGLNRYDGYSIERFEHDPFDRNSLSHNLIQTMHYDRASGVLWLGTYGGLNRFDPRTRDFTVYDHAPEDPRSLSNNVVVAVERDAEQRLWIGTLEGLNRFDPPTGGFDRYLPDGSPDALPNKVVRDIRTDRLGRVWVGTYGGLSRYVPAKDGFETITADGPADTSLPSNYVMSILPDPNDDHVLWLGTWDGGVSRLDTQTGIVETIRLENDDIYTMMFDSSGHLWVGTWGGGICVIDPDSGEHTSIVAGANPRTARLSHNVAYSFLEDESGIVWIGTNGGGVNAYVPWENRFRAFVHDPADPSTIASGKIETIRVDPDGTLWAGVYNGGLNRYDPATGAFRRYRHDEADPDSLSNDIVNEVFRDSQGRLWVGTNLGLNRYVAEIDAFERILASEGELPEDTIFEIAESPDGELWLGTHTTGIVVYDPDTGGHRIVSHRPNDPGSLTDNLVRSIVFDERGDVWIATNHGLNRLDPVTGRITRYLHDRDDPQGISNNNVRMVHQDRSGVLWVVTAGGGVNRYDYETDGFELIATEEGLASHHVVAAIDDDRGRLWFPTNRGISVYDPDTGEARTLDVSNGLLSNELTQAVAPGPDGALYFGSSEGITVVDTAAQAEAEYAPPVVVTEFKVLGSPRRLERSAPDQYEPVELDHADSYFSFEFSALDYSSPEKNSYAYTLEGFDDGWNTPGNRNYASYTNIPPGRYSLRVRGAGSRGNWNDRGVSVPIVVNPPWWGSNVAYAGYAALATVVALAAFLAVQRRQRSAHDRLVEQERLNEKLEKKVSERTAEIERSRALAERATREKSLFLANMSHEIRTPLTGMTGMVSLLENSALDLSQREYLRYLRTTSENLTTLVNDLLDFERIEAGELRLTRAPFSIAESARYVEKLFAAAAREKGIELTVDVGLEGAPSLVVGDPNRFVQVLTNLVSNAIKYTSEGNVRVEVAAVPEEPVRRYRIEVEDTGIGIDPDEREQIFEQFRQLDNGYAKTARGVGLGLAIVRRVVDAMGGTIEVDSEPGRGSRFTVLLPLEPASEGRAADLAPTGTEDQTPASAAQAPRSASLRILVCEDEAINRLYLTRHLEALGHTTDEAVDGVQAVAKALDAPRYDLVLMDLGMPGISGIVATERIRADELEQDRDPVPILALTAHTYGEDIETCYAAGMNGFLAKPIREGELEEELERWKDRAEREPGTER
jgi:signal transduction histidine kinase/ligand-binding sensor domain-containing protein/ActR/RegA family two-component response regulator